MADLQTPDIQIANKDRGMEPSSGAGSFLSGIVKGVSDAASTFIADQTASKIAQNKQDTLDAQNEVAKGLFGVSQQDNNGIDVPQSVVSGMNTVKNIDRAEGQGAVPLGTTDLHVQNVVSKAFADHPGQEAKIMEYVKGSGYDSLLFQNIAQRQIAQKAQENAQNAEQQTAYEAGAKYTGLTNPDGSQKSFNDVVNDGRVAITTQAKYEAAKEVAEAEAKKTAAGLESDKAKVAQAEQDMSGVISQKFSHATDSIMPYLNAHMATIQNSPDRESQLLSLRPQFEAVLNQASDKALADAAAGHLSESQTAVLKGQINSTKESLKDFYSGDGSVFKVNQANLSLLTSRLNLTAVQASQAMYMMKQMGILGPVLQQGLTDTSIPIPQSVINDIKQGFQGINSPEGARGNLGLQELGGILTGKIKLPQVSPQNVPLVVGQSANASNLYGSQIAHGSKDPTATNQFVNAYGTITDATHSLQVQGSPDIKSAALAADVLTKPDSRQAIIKLQATDPERGEALMESSRSAAQHALLTVKNSNTLNHADVYLTDSGLVTPSATANRAHGELSFDAKSGMFVIKVNDTVNGQPGAKSLSSALISPDLKLKADTMNKLIDHLAKTTQYDKNFPQGATPLSLRNFYATGATLTNAKGQPIISEAQKSKESGDSLFNQDIENTRKSLNNQLMNPQDGSLTRPDSNEQHASNGGSGMSIQKNNPGNIRSGSNSFRQYATADEGIQALGKNLHAYWTVHGIDNIQDIVSRWAPPSDHNDTPAYIAAVAKETGFGKSEKLDMDDPLVLTKLANAIIRHENGKNPYKPEQVSQAIMGMFPKT